MRRWKPDTEYEVNGLRFRIVRGTKVDYFGEPFGDLVLEVETRKGWRKVSMHLPGFMTDFLCENEELRYPPERNGFPTGLAGGHYLIRYLRKAWTHGWELADEDLQRERAQASMFDEARP